MKKELREKIRLKYNNRCAYTGKELDDNYQIDHITPQYLYDNNFIDGDKNDINNLIPSLKIINHYKRANNLESFRNIMKTFHIRLAKLPKKTNSEKTIKRIKYMNDIANSFGITVNNPFNGTFYFETI